MEPADIRLSQVVLERWARGRSTLLTTNLAKRAFAHTPSRDDDE